MARARAYGVQGSGPSCRKRLATAHGPLTHHPFLDCNRTFTRQVTGGQCPAYLSGYSVVTAVGGDGSDVNSLPMSCLNAFKSTACAPETVDFPKCQCTTKAFATPFAVKPMMSEMAGPSKDTTSYCFELAVVAPANPGSACGKTSTVNKAEFFADDTKRRQIKSIGIKPAGAAGYKWVAPSWGAVGDQTLKVTLGWSTAQAAGGRICLELYNTTSLDDFCMGAAMDTCWWVGRGMRGARGGWGRGLGAGWAVRDG